jgi:hypothetical protein
VVKTGPDSLNSAAVDRINAVPPGFSLDQNYPNPFNSMTTISFSLPKAGRVKVEVFDVMGRLARVLTDEMQTAGEHSVVFDGTGMASGIYFARVQAGEIVKVQKIVMVK